MSLSADAENRDHINQHIMSIGDDAVVVPERYIQERFHRSPYLPLRKVECSLEDGVLILRGRVPTFYLKQLAQSIAHSLNGVCRVANELLVDFPRQRAWQ